MVVGCWLLVVGCWLWLLVVGCWLLLLLLLLLLLWLWLLWLLLVLVVVVVGGGGAAAAALVTLRSFVYCCGAGVKAKCKRQSNALASWQAPFFDRSSSSASDSANRAVP